MSPAGDFYFSRYPGLEPALSVVEGSWASFVSPFGLKKKLSVVGGWVSVGSCRCQLPVSVVNRVPHPCQLRKASVAADGMEWNECRRLKPARDFYLHPTQDWSLP